MSETVDRLNKMEEQTARAPWPVGSFGYVGKGWPAAAFAFVYGLNQAWPLLREEIAELEEEVARLRPENAQLRAEHARLVPGATALGHQLEELKTRYEDEVSSLRSELEVARRERDDMQRAIAALPRRIQAAERVCNSIRTTMPGPRRAVPSGAHGWFDGTALDEWKAAP